MNAQVKYLYIRQNKVDNSIIIVGDESEIGGRDKAYTQKGIAGISYPRVTEDIMLGKNGYNRDYDVHVFIKNYCYDLVEYISNKKEFNTIEAFKCIGDPTTCIQELYKRVLNEVNKSETTANWGLRRGPQADAANSISNFFKTSEKAFLLNAFCRMGKTFTTLYTFTEYSDYNSAMFISGKTEAIRECKQTPHKCGNFDGKIEVIDFDQYDELVANNNLPKRWVLADTCQQIYSRVKTGKTIPSVGVIFFDECHFYNTDKLAEAISGKYQKLINMSATPVALLNSGNFTPSKQNIFEFTLVDLYKALENKTLDNPDDYILPRMFIPDLKSSIKTMQADPSIKDSLISYYEDCTENNGFSFGALFELTPNKNTFLHEDEVKLFARALANFFKSAGDRIGYKDLKNFMVFMPQRHEITEKFAGLLRDELQDAANIFNTVNSNKDEDGDPTSNENVLSQIKSCMSRNDKLNIILSYQRFGTGSTIPDLQAVMFLNDTDNSSVILQNLSRCLSANGKKPYGVIFEMNQSRAIVDRFKIITSKYGQFLEEHQAQQIFGETLNLMPISCLTEFGDLREIALNYDEAFMSYRKLDGASNIFETAMIEDMDEILNVLKNLDKFEASANLTNEQEAIIKASKVISLIKKPNNKQINSSNKELEIKEKLLTLSNYIKTSWFNSDAKSYNEFYDYFNNEKNTEEFKDITSVSWPDYNKYIYPIIKLETLERICNAFLINTTQENLYYADGQVLTTEDCLIDSFI